MSFLKRLFGGGGGPASAGAEKPTAETEYKGYAIRATPQKEGQQFRLCGAIEKDVDGERRLHRLIRADLFASADDATEATLRKARQVIDEQGDRIFTQR
jgi:hypothetical protein